MTTAPRHPGMTRVVAILLLLGGCTSGGGWVKPGAEEGAAAQEYQECRALADSAVRTEADIDQDIAATRQTDWQRSGLGQVQSRTMRENTRDRAAAIIASCMQAKGFAPAG